MKSFVLILMGCSTLARHKLAHVPGIIAGMEATEKCVMVATSRDTETQEGQHALYCLGQWKAPLPAPVRAMMHQDEKVLIATHARDIIGIEGGKEFLKLQRSCTPRALSADYWACFSVDEAPLALEVLDFQGHSIASIDGDSLWMKASWPYCTIGYADHVEEYECQTLKRTAVYKGKYFDATYDGGWVYLGHGIKMEGGQVEPFITARALVDRKRAYVSDATGQWIGDTGCPKRAQFALGFHDAVLCDEGNAVSWKDRRMELGTSSVAAWDVRGDQLLLALDTGEIISL